MKEILHLDWDWKPPKKWIEAWKKTKTAMLESLGYKVTDIIMRESPSKKGYHIWIHLETAKPIPDEQLNMLQWLCLDDPVRVRINQLRIRRGLRRFWNKLFARRITTFPRSDRCRNCKILIYLREASNCPWPDDLDLTCEACYEQWDGHPPCMEAPRREYAESNLVELEQIKVYHRPECFIKLKKSLRQVHCLAWKSLGWLKDALKTQNLEFIQEPTRYMYRRKDGVEIWRGGQVIGKWITPFTNIMEFEYDKHKVELIAK